MYSELIKSFGEIIRRNRLWLNGKDTVMILIAGYH